MGFDVINIGMHVSPTDMKGDGDCARNLLPKHDSGTVPKIQVILYNGKAPPTQAGYFDYQKLDEKHIEGISSKDSFTFSWTYVSVSLDASSASDGFVTLRIRSTSEVFGHYDAIDNLKIVGSDKPIALSAPVPDSPPTGDVGNGYCGRPYEPSCVAFPGMPNRHICTFCSPDCPGE